MCQGVRARLVGILIGVFGDVVPALLSALPHCPICHIAAPPCPVLVNSPTGTGKTLAYAIPIIHDLQALSPPVKRADGPYALIILPTRELVLQSLEVIDKLVKPYIWIVPGAVMGGEKKQSEKARLRKGTVAHQVPDFDLI